MGTSGSIKAAKYGYVITSLIFCVAGILLILQPGTSMKIICDAIGIICIIFGVIKLIGYFSKDLYRLAFQFDLALGIFTLIIGFVMVLHTERLISFLHFIIGVFALSDGLFKVQTALDARRFGIGQWWMIGLTAIITVLFGFVLIFNPFEGAKLLMMFMGITLLSEGVLNLCVAVFAVKIIKGKNHIIG